MRRLRRLVSLLILVLIGGMLVVVVAMVVQLGAFRAAPEAGLGPVLGPVAAESLALPEGAEPLALGRAPGQVLVITRDAAGAETFRVLDAETGAELSATPIRRE